VVFKSRDVATLEVLTFKTYNDMEKFQVGQRVLCIREVIINEQVVCEPGKMYTVFGCVDSELDWKAYIDIGVQQWIDGEVFVDLGYQDVSDVLAQDLMDNLWPGEVSDIPVKPVKYDAR
jgi:hypothetical protein